MFAKYFTGQAYLARLTHDQALNCPVSNVTFEPGCRNNWHSHTGGQAARRRERPGILSGQGRTCAGIAAGRTWSRSAPRGATGTARRPRQWFSHLAVETNRRRTAIRGWSRSTTAQYAAATAPAAAVVPQLGAEALRNRAGTFPQGDASGLGATDPELIEIFDNFAFGEVAGYGDLDTPTRMMCIPRIVYRCAGAGRVPDDARRGAQRRRDAVEAKEVLYQAVPYVGMAKVLDFVHNRQRCAGDARRGASARRTVDDLAGDAVRKGTGRPEGHFRRRTYRRPARSGPRRQKKHIQDYLSMNCFGDFVTRGGLGYTGTREPADNFRCCSRWAAANRSSRGISAGNLNVGNDKRTLLTVITQLLPYVGYPAGRSTRLPA